ncbi:hypothetical protein Lal_00033125 [Lupinus albus]|nr:hypothetical protein Lal_00044982 [Lupinus albus]KAF1855285.1 hypothetical protein Lal_00044984 [Lupinus albus]KAF1876837.1 hypothetical protein Lal_00033125 [Lupinus albus]
MESDKRLVGLTGAGGGLYFWERTPGEYEAHGYKFCLGMKENSESALSTNKEGISNVTRNLMESSILAQDERWRHALHMQVGREVVFPVADGHGPDSYGRQQWGIFRNGRKPDGAMPRGGRRPTGHELLFPEKKQ